MTRNLWLLIFARQIIFFKRAAQMKKVLPKVKLFMFVTDPIQRIYSHLNMCIRNKYPM